jgi:hypothetical protein
MGQDLSGKHKTVHSSSAKKPNLSSPTLILGLRDTILDEIWTQGSPQHKKQVSKEVFFKFKDFPSDFA